MGKSYLSLLTIIHYISGKKNLLITRNTEFLKAIKIHLVHLVGFAGEGKFWSTFPVKSYFNFST